MPDIDSPFVEIQRVSLFHVHIEHEETARIERSINPAENSVQIFQSQDVI
jgi:hypothetical protein